MDGFDASKIQVWLNEEDFRVENETTAGTYRIDVEKIIMHPQYDPRRIDNDIAVGRISIYENILNLCFSPGSC